MSPAQSRGGRGREGGVPGTRGARPRRGATFFPLGRGALLIDEPLRVVVECGFIFFLSDNPTSRNPNFFLGFR